VFHIAASRSKAYYTRDMKPIPQKIIITEANAGQRIDNYLLAFLKGVPKSRIYRSLRQGEVRVNKHRIKPNYRLNLQDEVRIPPLRIEEAKTPGKPSNWQLQTLKENILYEDEGLLIINKPVGMAVHGGSGINFGVIETLRQLRPDARFLELIHRLDRDTSGCLMIAKKRSTLTKLHELLRTQQVEKVYLTLVCGVWRGEKRKVNLPLLKQQLISGERMVRVSEAGKPSFTIFQPIQRFKNATLVKATLGTGRTHQIRVHAAHIGHPIAGDEKYGDKNFNKQMRESGLKRLFLHAASISFQLPDSEQKIGVCACMEADLINFLRNLSS
jgi:23S rRNA pseudouridine955/2504/2580 synthase